MSHLGKHMIGGGGGGGGITEGRDYHYNKSYDI